MISYSKKLVLENITNTLSTIPAAALPADWQRDSNAAERTNFQSQAAES
jgi:hypothetical protein